jgi:hypothetical protein
MRPLLRFVGVAIPYGTDAAYATAAAANCALDGFLGKVGLPVPIRVDEGDGIAIYWPFTAAVGEALWRPVAHALRDACERAGLAADHAVTTDPLSLWRTPGTTNRAVDPPTRIVVADWGDGAHELRELHERLRRSQGPIIP